MWFYILEDLYDLMTVNQKIRRPAKQTHFFSHESMYVRGFEWYAQQMPQLSTQYMIIDIGLHYFETPLIAERIAKMGANTKIIIVLCDPVDRTIREYQYKKSIPGNIENHFELKDLIENPDGTLNLKYMPVWASIYVRSVRHWHDLFQAKNILFLDGDQLLRNPAPQLNELEIFLGVPKSIKPDNFVYDATRRTSCRRRYEAQTECLTKLAQQTLITDSTSRQMLCEFYRILNNQLFAQINKIYVWS